MSSTDVKGVPVGSKWAVISVPYLWLTLFFIAPFVIVFYISFSKSIVAMPPYASLWQQVEGTMHLVLNYQNYTRIFSPDDPLYLRAYWNSLKLASISTLLCLLVGYPMAYGIARAPGTLRHMLMMLIVLPSWTSFLIRIYSWIGLLKTNGFINNFLIWTGLIDTPIQMMQTDFAVYIGIVYAYLPFMVLPLYTNLLKHDPTLLEAAHDLGATPTVAFCRITLPLSLNGIIAGSMLVFIPAVGEFVIPSLLGGPNQLMIGRVLYDQFFAARDWPSASAVAITMLVILVGPIMLFQRAQNRELEADK